ncbi:hypothetical protein [Sphingomonas sp. R86521]|uniref:hypothetical protein n=1 Tax=Sphingomonas sp. R86521 TaxID=3093860 RepID=UPI0036D3F8B3
MAKIPDTPSDVSTDEGGVQVDGPGGAVVSMTPDAAAETSERMPQALTKRRGISEIAYARRRTNLRQCQWSSF